MRGLSAGNILTTRDVKTQVRRKYGRLLKNLICKAGFSFRSEVRVNVVINYKQTAVWNLVVKVTEGWNTARLDPKNVKCDLWW